MAKIYKITNTVNQKIYVGCTIKSIDERFQEHKSRAKVAKYKSKLYNSINKYGIENFTIELVIECKDLEMFNLEIKYIEE
jgi:group I intron endonuclease